MSLYERIFGKSGVEDKSDIEDPEPIDSEIKTERRDSMPRAKFIIFEGKNEQWYFRLQASNGKIIAQSEGYTRKENALGGIESVKNCAASATIEEGEKISSDMK